MTEDAFNEWFNEQEGYALRAERFDGDVEWLKAAFEAGRRSPTPPPTDGEGDLVARLRDTARTFARDDPAPDSPAESYVEWEAATAIEALRAERDEALREIDRVAGISSHAKNSLAVAEAQVSTLSRQLEEAREALSATPAIRDIAAERQRQIIAEGWTPEHDDTHDGGELAAAAACYAHSASRSPHSVLHLWPWSWDWFKQRDEPRRKLIKAGALIVAEIERLDRRAKETVSHE